MTTVTRILGTTHEVSLKGGNRRWFEGKLTAAVNRALSDLPIARIERPSWRVLVTFKEPVPFVEAARRLGTVFGIHSIKPIIHAGQTLDDLQAAIAVAIEGKSTPNFAVRCLRSDKSYPMTSTEIEVEVGGVVQEQTGWPVNLGNPALKIQILLDVHGFSFWLHAAEGPGGLPTGTGGRASCLLSGGIDSPVSAYAMMKRGMVLDFVHFHSFPQTDPASMEKVEELVEILVRFQGPARLAMVPLLPIQEAIIAHCPAEFRVLLYRRFMLRIAEKLARKFRSKALITGESLGQVASQTIENLVAVEAVTRMPVLRPLISLDKQEIIKTARRAGTYETSIRPHFDCCSFHLPERPATKSKAWELDSVEEELDIHALVMTALRNTEITRFTKPADWNLIPPPAGAEI